MCRSSENSFYSYDLLGIQQFYLITYYGQMVNGSDVKIDCDEKMLIKTIFPLHKKVTNFCIERGFKFIVHFLK